MTNERTASAATRAGAMCRNLLKAGLAAVAARPALVLAAPAQRARYRVAVIGHTGAATTDTAWTRSRLETPGVRVEAVADADPQGLGGRGQAAPRPQGLSRLPPNARRGEARPGEHLPAVARPALRHGRGRGGARRAGHLHGEAHVPHVGRGRRHGRGLREAQGKIRHRVPDPLQPEAARGRGADPLGELGQVLEYRARGKENRRGAREDLWVLGVHMFNLIHHFAGKPRWCFGSVEQNGRPVRKEDVQPGAEGLARWPATRSSMHGLESGAAAYFDSTRNAGGSLLRVSA